MDLTKLPSSLLYTHKNTLGEFGTKDVDLHQFFMKTLEEYQMKGLRRMDQWTLLAEMLNDVYYLIIMSQVEKDFVWHIDVWVKHYLTKWGKREDIVFAIMGMLNSYMMHFPEETNAQEVRRATNGVLRLSGKDTTDYFHHFRAYKVLSLELSFDDYPMESISDHMDVYEKVKDTINWSALTDRYSKQGIDDLVNAIGKTEQDKELLNRDIQEAKAKKKQPKEILKEKANSGKKPVIIQNITGSQVFNGAIVDSEFKGNK